MGGVAELWWIYHLRCCSYTRPEPKPKLVVIVCRDDYARGFLINSEIDVWIRISEWKLASQVPILAVDHSRCLDYNSYVDCLDLYRFEEHELTEKRQPVSMAVKQAIMTAVKVSRTIERKYKRLITCQE